MSLNKIMIVGEAWGKEEAAARLPFVGPSGKILDGMLRQAGIVREHCYLTNVFNFQPVGKYPDNDLKNVCGSKAEAVAHLPALSSGKYVRAEYQGELDRLYREIRNEKPNLIIAFGATAAWALLETSGIRKIRGAPSLTTPRISALVGAQIKVLPTYHPAAVMREWTIRPIVISDLIKAERESHFPELRRPSREIWIEPTLDDLAEFEHRFILPNPDLSIDIETAGEQVTCVGFAPTINRAIVVPFVNSLKRDGNYWETLGDELAAWEFVRRWCAMTVPQHIRQRMQYYPSEPRKRGIGQNHLYDIHYLWRTYGIILHADEDTMLLHHALQPEMEKGLGFQATIYTDELAWKFMRAKHETLKKED